MAEQPGGLEKPNDVTVRITGNTDGLKAAIRDAERNVAGFKEKVGGIGEAGLHLANMFKSIGNAFAGIGTMAGFAIVLNQMREIASIGQQFQNQMEQTLLGLKAIYAQQINVYDAQWNQVALADKMLVSQKAIATQIEKIKTDALVTTATLSQITGIFQMALPVALSMGMSLDQTRGFVVSMVKTAGAMGVPMEHLNMEVRDALQGYVQMEDKMLRSLGLTTEKLQQWKAAGPDVLVQNLLKKMEAFDAASEEAGNTWAGLTSTMDDFKQQLSGMVMAPAIEVMRKAMMAIRDSLGEVQNGIFVFNDKVITVVNVLKDAFEQLVKMLLAVGETVVQIGTVLAVLDEATGGTLKWVAAGYALLSVFQALKLVVQGLMATKWFSAGVTALGLTNPVTMWVSVALLGLTAVMTLWNRMKGSIEEDLSGFDARIKDMQTNVDKSKQREASLSDAGEKVGEMEAPGKFAGGRGEGVRRLAEAGEAAIAETADEVKWVEDMKKILNPLTGRYKSLQALFEQKEFSKAAVMRAIAEAKAEEQEEQKKEIANARVELLEKDTLAKANLALANADVAQAEADLKQEDTWDQNGVLIQVDKKEAAERRKAAEKRRQDALAVLEEIPKAAARLDAKDHILAVPNETPQEKAIREKKEAISIEVSMQRTLLTIEENLLNTERGRKIASTGYYLAVHGLQQQELKDMEAALALKVKHGELTDAQAAKYLQHAKAKQAMDLKANVQSMIDGTVSLRDIPVVVRQQAFRQQQETEAAATRAQIQKDILAASAQMERANAEVTRLKAIADPMKQLDLPKKEQEAKDAAAKSERTYADAEVRLMELRRKQYEDSKAEEERVLNHRKAMGQMTEKDELDRLYRIANSEEETRANREKAMEQHFAKFKSMEQSLFDYRKGMGLISMELEISRLRSIAGAANRTAEERMAAEQKVYELEQQLLEKRRGAAKTLVNMGKEYLTKKYGEAEANRSRSQADWGRVADEAIYEKQRDYDQLKWKNSKTPEEMQRMYDLDKELSDMRKQRKELGGTEEVLAGGTVQTPAADEFKRIRFSRDQLLQKKDRTPEEDAQLKTYQDAMPGAYRAMELEGQGETKIQREAAAGTSPAAPAFAAVAKALGFDVLPSQANKAFEQVATSYTALLRKMEEDAAVAGAKINTFLYEGFVWRLKQDLTNEVNQS